MFEVVIEFDNHMLSIIYILLSQDFNLIVTVSLFWWLVVQV